MSVTDYNRLAALRAAAAPPKGWDDPANADECLRCHTMVNREPDSEPAPTCNSCAQTVLAEVREILFAQSTVRTLDGENCGVCGSRTLQVAFGRCLACGVEVPPQLLARPVSPPG